MQPRGDGYKYYNNIEIQGFHSSGKGFFQDGKKRIYVDNTVPGDILDVKVAKRQKKFIGGNVVCKLQESLLRTPSFCIHAQLCGGCNWQHIKYEAQLQFKRQVLFEALQKYEIKAPDIPPVIPSSKITSYRNKLDFTIEKDKQGKVVFGFHPVDKPYELFEVKECQLFLINIIALVTRLILFFERMNFQVFDFNAQSGTIKNISVRGTTTGDLMIILGLNDYSELVISSTANFLKTNFPEVTSFCYALKNNEKRFFSDEIKLVYGHTHLTERMDNLQFCISPASFYQPNPVQAIALYKKIKEFADLKKGDFVYDLYTGAGTIACFIASEAGKVIGMEGSPEAVSDAIKNAEINNLSNLEFICSDILLGFTKEFVDKHEKPNTIILDPPRSGTLIEIKKAILHAAPEKIVYVSCNPVSLAWDLKQLCEITK